MSLYGPSGDVPVGREAFGGGVWPCGSSLGLWRVARKAIPHMGEVRERWETGEGEVRGRGGRGEGEESSEL